MKKFVIVERIGTWKESNGKTIIDCTVKEHRIYAEANEREALTAPKREYRADGTWHDYSIECRKDARRWVKP